MVARAAGPHLLGRQRECDVLERVLASARDGEGTVLAVRGEPGVGKTALLDYAVEAASDFRVTRAVGVEGEMEGGGTAKFLRDGCTDQFPVQSSPSQRRAIPAQQSVARNCRESLFMLRSKKGWKPVAELLQLCLSR